MMDALKIEDGFRPHAEEQVQDAEVGQKAVLLPEDLPIGARAESGVGLRMLGADDVAVVAQSLGAGVVRRGVAHRGLDVHQLADLLPDGLVEVDQILVLLLEEGTDVVGVVLEEGAFAVGALQGVPVDPPPLVVVADAQVAGLCLFGGVLHRHGQRLRPVGGGDDSPVAVGLLLVGVALLYQCGVSPIELLVPLDGAEIGGL